MSVQKHPDLCPDHPHNHLSRSEHRKSDFGGGTFVQYWCGHEGCQQPLGWQMINDRTNLNGPGLCPDPTMPEQVNVGSRKAAAVLILFMIALGVFFFIATSVFLQAERERNAYIPDTNHDLTINTLWDDKINQTRIEIVETKAESPGLDWAQSGTA